LPYKLVNLPDVAESFAIKSINQNNKKQIIICGYDNRGLLYGVYELIEIYMSKISGSEYVDISFDFKEGSGRAYDITNLDIDLSKSPFYKNRGIHLDFISMGTGAMLGIDSSQPKDKEVWKR